jgi:hypothetical protein
MFGSTCRTAERPGRLHERQLLDAEHETADEAGVVDPPHGGHREREVQEAGAERPGDREREQEAGERQQHVDDAHHEPVDEAAGETRQEADRDADHQDARADGQRGEHRDARAVEDPRELVPPKVVGAEEVTQTR